MQAVGMQRSFSKHPPIRRWIIGAGRNTMLEWDESKKDLGGLEEDNLYEKQGTK